MARTLGVLVTFGTLLAGTAMARQLLTPDRRARLARLPETVMKRCLEHMPEDSPPKAIMSAVDRIQSQNDEILALLQEQNELLRRRAPRRTQGPTTGKRATRTRSE